MFNNRFNSKNDPVLEAVTNAMKDGDMRRQAEALVNEEFGVYSRKAVVREDLAAYDARLEEAYKCMKEGKPLADKDYDKDGKIESPKDEVWGSRLRAAKAAGKMEEEQIDEISRTTLKSYVKKADRQAANLERKVDRRTDSPGEEEKMYKRIEGSNLARRKMGVKVAATNEGLDVVKRDPSVQGSGDVSRSPKGYEDPSTPKVPYSELPKTGNRAGAVIDSAKGALKEDEQIDELKQSTVRSYIEKSMTAAKAKREAGFKKDFTEKKGKKAEKARGEFNKRTKGLSMAAKKLAEENIDEAVSRKHFQQVADLIKSNPDQAKRNELASHHAGIFAKQNPRFNHEKFHAASGSTAHEAKTVKESIFAKIRAKHMKEDQSF